MLTVRSQDVGEVGFERMVRDGVIVLSVGHTALPRDIGHTPAVRAHVLARDIPRGHIVTGEAGWWVHAGGPPPRWVDTLAATPQRATYRNDHLPIRSHLSSESVPTVQVASLAVATPPHCAADALRWGALERAIPATMRGLAKGTIPWHSLVAAARQWEPRSHGRLRALSALKAIASATGVEFP